MEKFAAEKVIYGISVVNQHNAETLFDRATLAAVWMNEIAILENYLKNNPLKLK